MRNKKLLIILAVASICILAMTIGGSTPSTEKHTDQPDNNLNLLITNEDSNIDELSGLDKRMNKYLEKWFFKGMSLAITRNDSLVYAKGYGWADEEKGIKMEPGHIMRLASVSKLITATGIMVLQDMGKLKIQDPVFGPQGVLKDSLYIKTIKDPNYQKITIEHLLRHQGGFYRDPVFSSREVKYQMRLDAPPTRYDFFRLVLGRRLKFKPGSWERYSNFGYLLLSEIIEKVSGVKYEEFIKKHVLEPAGCYDMHICGNYYKDKRANEVRYYTHEGDGKFIEEYNDSGNMVERCYGGSDINLLSGAGAWSGSTIELARFIASIDGDDTVKDIISRKSFEQMTEYVDSNTFSLGWNDTNPNTGWSRSGTLAGTCAYVKHYPDGECWILVSNTSTWKGPAQARITDALFKQCRELYSNKLPAVDLFQ